MAVGYINKFYKYREENIYFPRRYIKMQCFIRLTIFYQMSNEMELNLRLLIEGEPTTLDIH